MKRYPSTAALSQARAGDGSPTTCPVCGYANLRVTIKDGWTLEMCSAVPVVPAIPSQALEDWVNLLPSSKLPTIRSEHILNS